ncbi:MAG: hypothetical protein JWP97_4656 [Labilithrix sp.]|nr:hypothetical protein [Labilithrix sp.]
MLAAAAAIALLAQVAPPAAPAAAPLPTLAPTRTAEAPKLDGDLSDPVWATAAATSAFTQKFPVEGSAPTERTTMRVLYDDAAIYVAFDVEQRTVPVVARMARRDREIEADTVSVVIDSRALGKTAFEFTVNAAGVLRDGIRSNDVVYEGTRYNPGWDENWDARTKLREGGWTAEIRIPLRVLRFAAGSVTTWGFQARRYTSMRQETDEWAFVPRNVTSEVARYGRLVDLRMSPRPDLELRPFVLTRLVRRDRTDVTLERGLTPGASAGLDLRWHLTPDLTLDGTINPDFTQVEGDELFLNLSNFESFFPEKRPFFVEGADIFEQPAPLFFGRPFTLLYTRRIGLRPRSPSLRPVMNGAGQGDILVSAPDASTILGATKLVGRLGRSWSLGAMSALTAPNTVEVQEPGGYRKETLAEPTTAFGALRLKHDLEGGRAHVGVLGTAVVRAERTDKYPFYAPPSAGGAVQTVCPDGTEIARGARCTHDAYVGSADAVWRSANNEILLSGQAIASLIQEGPPRVTRDGSTIGSGNAGYGAQLVATREGGSGLAWNAQYQLASRHLDFNDLGYMERQNQHFYYANLEYRTFEPIGPTIETKTWIEVTGRYNLNGQNANRRWLTDTLVRYQNFWTSYLEVNFDERRLDDREVGNGVPLERPSRPGIAAQLATDKSKAVYGELNLFAQKTPKGGLLDLKSRAIFRVHPQLELELVPSASYTTGETRFATFGETPHEMVFGELRASSFATTARLNFTITPRLALQTFGQLYLAAGHYGRFRSFTTDETGPGSDPARLDALVPVAAPAVSPDFLDASINVNVVLRWEYSLGSVLYFVANRTQTPASAITLGEPAQLSFVPVGRSAAVDTLLLKWQLYVNL